MWVIPSWMIIPLVASGVGLLLMGRRPFLVVIGVGLVFLIRSWEWKGVSPIRSSSKSSNFPYPLHAQHKRKYAARDS